MLRKSVSTTPRKSVSIVVGMLVSAIEAVGKVIRWGLLWGLILLVALLVFTAQRGRRFLLAGLGRDVLTGVMHVADKGFGRDGFLFVGLLGCALAAVTHVMAGQNSVALLFCLLGVLMCVGLLIGDRGEGAQSSSDRLG